MKASWWSQMGLVDVAVDGASIDELLVRTGRGDRQSFARLYDTVAARVFGMALRVICDHAYAEDVTQDCLVEVWKSAPSFDPDKGSAINWIMTIAHRRAVDRVRSVQAARDRDQRFTLPERDFDTVADAVTDSAERQALRRCLKFLTVLQRQSIMLAYFDGLSYQQVSENVGARLPAVKSRMRDGLMRLRDCLGVGR